MIKNIKFVIALILIFESISRDGLFMFVNSFILFCIKLYIHTRSEMLGLA